MFLFHFYLKDISITLAFFNISLSSLRHLIFNYYILDVFFIVAAILLGKVFDLYFYNLLSQILFLAPTGALIVTMWYYILMQLMLQE